MTPADLDAIRARDASWDEGKGGTTIYASLRFSQSQMVADRRALRILVDQLLAREREARELLTVPICAWPECPDCRKIKAWLAAPSPLESNK